MCLPHADTQVTQRIATCQPLSRALDNGRVILCDMVADPWVSALSSSGLMVVETPMRGAVRSGHEARQGPCPQACTPALPLSSENASQYPSLKLGDWGVGWGGEVAAQLQ